MTDNESEQPQSTGEPSHNTPDDQTPSRQYLRIKPTDDTLSPTSIETHLRRLYDVSPPQQNDQSWFRRFLNSTAPPTVECLLVADNEDATVEYLFGIDDEYELTTLERLLRGLFPDTYEFEQTTRPLPLPSITELTATESDQSDPNDDSTSVAAVEFQGVATRRDDWQTELTSFDTFLDDAESRVPLAAIGDAMANASVPMVYQVLVCPKPDWQADADLRREQLKNGTDTFSQRTADALFGPTVPDEESTDEGRSKPTVDRIAALDEKNARCSFDVNVRLVATDSSPDDEMVSNPTHAVRDLRSTFSSVSGEYYNLDGIVRTGDDAHQFVEAVHNRTFTAPNYDRLSTKLPWTQNASSGIVADISELPTFCLLGGDGLTADAHRALAPTPQERTGVPKPPTDELTPYQTDGLTLGRPLTGDNDSDNERLALPPSLQPLHVAWFGKTGSGKSTSLVNAMLDNYAATDGADILIDPKGDGMPVEYLRAHYATYESLDNVYYFDCTDTLPAISFFDIRDQLDDGINRTTAVEDVVDHYIEMLIGVMGQARFEQAVRSPDIIRFLVKALFDPVHGDDAFTHRDLQNTLGQMHEARDAPPVADAELEEMLGGVASNSKRSFDELMQGVANRIEKIPLDDRLAQLFNHIPEADDDPHFDFREIIDENAVIIFDTGGLRTESQRVLTLVLLSNLWTSLRRRTRQDDTDDPPLVNLYLEEAASVATSGLLTDLLAQSRSFGLSLTLAMQFPAQLRATDSEAYAELLNNVSTIVTGNVAVDAELSKRLATAEMDVTAVSNRLRALQRGQWFVSLPAPFGDPEPRPFQLESVPLPPGHPEGDHPLSDPLETSFDALFDVVQDRTRRDYGLDVTTPTQVDPEPDNEITESNTDRRDRVDSALPYTKRFPRCLEYDATAHALICGECETRYGATRDGMERVIQCCHDLEGVDRDNIPICDINLTLSPNERADSEYSDRQLSFLQAVYTAHQQRYDPELEYDLVTDSMVRLQEYVGIDSEDVQELLDDDLLSQDTNHPHRLYTVTPAGREEVAVGHREGIAHGDGKGDLSESSVHVLMVELGRRYIEQTHVADPESPVQKAVPYYEIDDGRLDAVGLDADDDVVVTVEAERSNHDTLRAVPADYDKMAAQEPDEAIWIVENRDIAHEILETLNDPPTGSTRVEKTYSQNTPPQSFAIDEDGLSAIHTLQYVRDSLLE